MTLRVGNDVREIVHLFLFSLGRFRSKQNATHPLFTGVIFFRTYVALYFSFYHFRSGHIVFLPRVVFHPTHLPCFSVFRSDRVGGREVYSMICRGSSNVKINFFLSPEKQTLLFMCCWRGIFIFLLNTDQIANLDIFYSTQASCIDVSLELEERTNSGQCHPGYKGKRCEKRE